MSSQARIDANRRNAQKSTGPRTPAGKARSSRNALKHGLASISPDSFLHAEDRQSFERMLDGYLRTHQPQHTDEVDLITDAVFCKWRQQRVWSSEANLIETVIAENELSLQKRLPKANAGAHVAHAESLAGEQLRLLRRYESQLHRQYLRNLKELRLLQESRTDLDPTLDDLYPENPPAPIEPNPEPPPPTPSPIEPNTSPKSPTQSATHHHPPRP